MTYYRADVHHDPQGPATDIKPWATGIAASNTLTTEDRMPSKKPVTRKPRIITKTVKRLREIAAQVRKRSESAYDDAIAASIDAASAELDASDARETRPDPSSRNARRRVKKL